MVYCSHSEKHSSYPTEMSLGVTCTHYPLPFPMTHGKKGASIFFVGTLYILERVLRPPLNLLFSRLHRSNSLTISLYSRLPYPLTGFSGRLGDVANNVPNQFKLDNFRGKKQKKTIKKRKERENTKGLAEISDSLDNSKH